MFLKIIFYDPRQNSGQISITFLIGVMLYENDQEML